MLNNICQILLDSYFYSMSHCICICRKFQYVLSISTKYYKKFMQYLSPTFDMLFIKNNNIFYIYNHSDIIKYLPLDYDYIIYNKTLQDKTLIKIISQQIDQLIDLQNIDKNFKFCEFEFIMVLVKGIDYSIDITNILKDKQNYYYVQDSILFDKHFINWFSINHLKRNLDNCYIVFLDNNINQIILNNNEFIKLSKNDYTIISH